MSKWNIIRSKLGTNMLHDGGYIQCADLLSFNEEEKVIWSRSKPISLETEIVPRVRPPSTDVTLSPHRKIDVIRQQTNLNLAFKRNDSPQQQFSPRRVKHGHPLETSSTTSRDGTKSAAVYRVDKMRKRRLQLSCRAINSLEELSQSWDSKNTRKEDYVRVSSLRFSQQQQQQQKQKQTPPSSLRPSGATSPRKSRLTIQKKLEPTVHDIDNNNSSTSDTDSPTLNNEIVSHLLATCFSAPLPPSVSPSNESSPPVKVEEKETKMNFLDTFINNKASQNKSKSTSFSHISFPHLMTFANLALTKRNMHNLIKNRRVIKDLKTDSSTLRKQHHSAEVIWRIHGSLTEQNIEKLKIATGYSRSQLYHHFLRFKALCTVSESPEGINRESFRSGLPSLSVEDSLFVNRVFDVVDTDRRGILDWAHYIHAMASLEQGTPVARTAFLWSVYDVDGGGTISRAELKRFFLSSLLATVDDFIEDVAEIFVEGVFSRITPNEKGELTLIEAMRYIESQKDVSDLHGMFGRSMADQGFAEIVDGTKNTQNEESKKEKIARNIRKIRRKEGVQQSLNLQDSSTNKDLERSHHANALIRAAATKKNKTLRSRSDSKWCNISEKEDEESMEWDLVQELATQYNKIHASTQVSKTAITRRTSVVFCASEETDTDSNDYQLKYGSKTDQRVKPKKKVVQGLKRDTDGRTRTSVRGRRNSLIASI